MPHSSARRNDKSMGDRLLVMWTEEEDEILREQVKLHGFDKWARIATQLCGKTSRQCRRRWLMFLNVVNKRGGWSADEDKLLLEAHRKFGNRWTEIAKKLPGRTDNAVKNRFCVLCKKQSTEEENATSRLRVDYCFREVRQKHQGKFLHEDCKAGRGTGAATKTSRLEVGTGLHLPVRLSEDKLKLWTDSRTGEVVNTSDFQLLAQDKRLQVCDHPLLIQRGSHASVFSQSRNTAKSHAWKRLKAEGNNSSHSQEKQNAGIIKDEDGIKLDSEITTEDNSMEEELQPWKNFNSQTPPSSSVPKNQSMSENHLQEWKPSAPRKDVLFPIQQETSLDADELKVEAEESEENPMTPQQTELEEPFQWRKKVDLQQKMSPTLNQTLTDERVSLCEIGKENLSCLEHKEKLMDEQLDKPFIDSDANSTAHCSKHSERTSKLQRWTRFQNGTKGSIFQRSIDNKAQNQAKMHHRKSIRDVLQTGERKRTWKDGKFEPVLPLSQLGANAPRCADFSTSSDGKSAVQHRPSQEHILNSRCTLEQGYNSAPQDLERHYLQQNGLSPRQKAKISWQPEGVQSQQLQGLKADEYSLDMVNPLQGLQLDLDETTLPQAPEEGGFTTNLLDDPWKGLAWLEYAPCSNQPTILESFNIEADSPSIQTQDDSHRGFLKFEKYLPDGAHPHESKDIRVICDISVNCPSQTEETVWAVRAELSMQSGRVDLEVPSAPYMPVSQYNNLLSNEVKGADEDASESTSPGVSLGTVQSLLNINPKHNLTVEGMPSPHFSDSEKEFLLSTLEESPTRFWPSSPLLPHPRLSRIRNPLLDVCYDTPARSPLSSCLLRQFQVSERSRIA